MTNIPQSTYVLLDNMQKNLDSLLIKSDMVLERIAVLETTVKEKNITKNAEIDSIHQELNAVNKNIKLLDNRLAEMESIKKGILIFPAIVSFIATILGVVVTLQVLVK